MSKHDSKSKDEQNQLMANYLHSLFTINPKIVFSTLMGVDYVYVDKGILTKLPSHISQLMKDEANGVAKSYDKYINSKEVKESVKKHGGGFYREK